jgi:hypothetical protein
MSKVNKFKIRSSGTGHIMGGTMGLSASQSEKLFKLNLRHTDPTAKPLTANMLLEYKKLVDIRNNPQLPQGARTYCDTWDTEQTYRKRRIFSTKYTEKGNLNEKESIKKIGKRLGDILIPNTKYFQNDYTHGTPDVIFGKTVIDAKSSWDPFTFPRRETTIPNLDYWWQVQSYMSLTGCDKAIVAYVLTNTPIHFIDRAARNEAFNKGMDEVPEDIFNKHYDNMTYDDVPEHLKIKLFYIERDDDAINQIKERVEACRVYLETIKIKS